jgi:hypothetical protein
MFAKLEGYRRQRGATRATTKRIPRFECGSSTRALGMLSLILIELLDLIRLDLFGTLATVSGSPCLPSSRTTAENMGIVLVLSPYRYKEDPSLGFWVMTQRGPRKKLDSEWIARLESLLFWPLWTNNGKICLPSLSNTSKYMGIVLSHSDTNRILHLVCGSQHSEVDGKNLIRPITKDLNQLALFGMLAISTSWQWRIKQDSVGLINGEMI